MRDDLYERKPRRRRRRRRVNWTGVFFWLVVLMALIAVIVMLVKPKQPAEAPLPSEESSNNVQQQVQQNQPENQPEVTLPVVPETSEPATEPPTEAPTEAPTEEPTEAPTEPPTEAPTEEPTSPPTEATAGLDDPAAYSSIGEAVAAVAKSAVGMPYEYGGSGPGTFDTSGLVYFCLKEGGAANTPRLVSEQAAGGEAVAKEDLQPGDVVFFYFETPGNPEYVGIYVGGGSFIAARSSEGAIGEMSLDSSYYTEHFVCARRYY